MRLLKCSLVAMFVCLLLFSLVALGVTVMGIVDKQFGGSGLATLFFLVLYVPTTYMLYKDSSVIPPSKGVVK